METLSKRCIDLRLNKLFRLIAFSHAGETLALSCSFNMEQESLYSLKIYKGKNIPLTSGLNMKKEGLYSLKIYKGNISIPFPLYCFAKST